MDDMLDGVKPKIMKKELNLLLVCETGKDCLEPIKDGVPRLNVKICLACDFAQIKLLGIKDYVEPKKEDVKEPVKVEEKPAIPQPINPSE